MMEHNELKDAKTELAESVQKACIEAVHDGFKEASMSGLCTEGAMEAAISAIQQIDLQEVIQKK